MTLFVFVTSRFPGITTGWVPTSNESGRNTNSDASLYGGSGQGNLGGTPTAPLPIHGMPYSLNMTLPPLGVVAFRPENRNV